MEIRAEDHIGLVMRVVKPYASSMKTSIMDSEVFSDGCVGLMQAVNAFDPTLEYQFSTFATACIKQAIHDGFRQRRHQNERRYKDGTIVRMHVSSACAELSQFSDDPLMRVVLSENEDRLKFAIASLPDRERTIVQLRLDGLGLKEIGEMMGYSKQRAEQIEKRAKRAIVDILTAAINSPPEDDIGG